MLSGLLIGTSYIPFPPWASLFCFVPLWMFWSRQKSLGPVIGGGIAAAFVFTLIGFNWVTYTLHEFAHLDWWLSVIGMVLFGFVAHLFVAVAGACWYLLSKYRRLEGWRSRALMAISIIFFQQWFPTLFDWNFGYSWLGAGLPVSQLSEWIGFSGLSALTVALNLVSWKIYRERSRPQGRLLIVGLVSVFLGANALGLWVSHHQPVPDATLRVLMVQGNIGNSEKIAAELGSGYQDGILDTYLKLTEEALAEPGLKPVDFILWPETAFPDFLGEGLKASPRRSHLENFVKSHHTALVTGAYGFDRDSGRLTNSLFLIDPEGRLVSPHYSKTILLAFGEYLPGESWFPFIRDWLPPIGEFQRGEGPRHLIQWNGFRMGVQICYESLFPDFSRQWADLGAEFFVNVTNDSWYGSWAEPMQHMTMTLGRAIEFRRPVLRATNTGISTVGLASGEHLEMSPLHQAWARIFELPYSKNPSPSFYQQYPHLVDGVVWAVLIFCLVMPACPKSKARTTHAVG